MTLQRNSLSNHIEIWKDTVYKCVDEEGVVLEEGHEYSSENDDSADGTWIPTKRKRWFCRFNSDGNQYISDNSIYGPFDSEEEAFDDLLGTYGDSDDFTLAWQWDEYAINAGWWDLSLFSTFINVFPKYKRHGKYRDACIDYVNKLYEWNEDRYAADYVRLNDEMNKYNRDFFYDLGLLLKTFVDKQFDIKCREQIDFFHSDEEVQDFYRWSKDMKNMIDSACEYRTFKSQYLIEIRWAIEMLCIDMLR